MVATRSRLRRPDRRAPLSCGLSARRSRRRQRSYAYGRARARLVIARTIAEVMFYGSGMTRRLIYCHRLPFGTKKIKSIFPMTCPIPSAWGPCGTAPDSAHIFIPVLLFRFINSDFSDPEDDTRLMSPQQLAKKYPCGFCRGSFRLDRHRSVDLRIWREGSDGGVNYSGRCDGLAGPAGSLWDVVATQSPVTHVDYVCRNCYPLWEAAVVEDRNQSS